MKTQVIMKRELFGNLISQQSDTGFFSANELMIAGNKWRASNKMPIINFNDWINRPTTKEFIKQLEKQTGKKVKNSSRGRSGSTWIHPFLFIDLALTISPKLKIEVYSWIYDSLLKYRNDSGDSYKKMCGALWDNASNKITFHKSIVKVADIIKKSCNVESWELATEEQLKTRDKIHENISLLCDVLRDNNQAVKIGISKAIN